ncbi:MAG TPA: hypothetical protein PKD99_09980 [Sphingopyxis sp.]|nr:hypothetical protein [Sphingopyxis sp.]HMP45422.1 hypothetical protein [Sphingopyxis sp.]HMQ18488.1 hypothetical protein [Sphingopyxis sp.]
MYAFVDRPVESLDNSGRFLLWAMRGWAQANGQGHCPPQALCRGFASARTLAALPDFHVAMALIVSDALEPVDLAPVPCRSIAESEAILLGLWRDVAQARTEAARATLALIIDPDSTGPLVNAMTAAATRLAAAGFGLETLSPSDTHHQESRQS